MFSALTKVIVSQCQRTCDWFTTRCQFGWNAITGNKLFRRLGIFIGIEIGIVEKESVGDEKMSLKKKINFLEEKF